MSGSDDAAFEQRIRDAVQAMSNADKSVVLAAIDHQYPATMAMGTTDGSPTDRLWRILSERGWTARLETPEYFPPGPFAMWTLTEEGAKSLAAVLGR